MSEVIEDEYDKSKYILWIYEKVMKQPIIL
jgi:hypothetical protein